MKIYRPVAYHKIVRVTFSKKNAATTDKRAVTIVETTKREVTDLIHSVFADDLKRNGADSHNFVKLTIQIIKYVSGGEVTKQTKDEFSFRLYNTDV